MNQQQLEQQIRFADQLASSYFSTLTRLRASGRRAVGGGMAYREDSLQSAIGDATGLADNLIDSTNQAKATAAATGIEGLPSQAEPFEAPALDDEQYTLIRLEEAQTALAEIRGLQAALPHVDWSNPSDDLDVDLFASKKKNAFIVGGVIAVAAVVLAFFYPMPAFIVGMFAVFFLGKPIMRELIWRRS